MKNDFDVEQWCKSIRSSLKKFNEVDLGYSKGNNYIQMATDNSRKELEKHLEIIPPKLQAFYHVCNELSLSDIYNGYFIATPVRIIEIRNYEYTPHKIEGRDFESEILMFGSNGGGGKFVITADSGKILYLPTYGAVENYVFDSEFAPIYSIADDLFGFLEVYCVFMKESKKRGQCA